MSIDREALRQAAWYAFTNTPKGNDHAAFMAALDRYEELSAAPVEGKAGWDPDNLEIVNGYLVERGALPLDYPAGPAHGARAYSDAEVILRLSDIPGWQESRKVAQKEDGT